MINGKHISVPKNSPVLDGQGMLVADHPDLESLANQGILTRILASDPKYKNHNKIVQQRRSGVHGKAEAPPVPVAEIPKAHTTVATGAQSLPPGVEPGLDGTFTYDGQSFASLGAVQVFIAQSSAK